MTRYWAIAPWPSDEQELFERVWRYDLEHKVITIGWDQVGDPAGLSRSEFSRRYKNSIPLWPGGEHQVWNFYNEIAMGDVLFAKMGQRFCVGVGRIISRPYFDPKQGRERVGGLLTPFVRSNFIGVDWRPVDSIPVKKWFPRKTLTEIKEPLEYPELMRLVS
jgi:hypothetical protein